MNINTTNVMSAKRSSSQNTYTHDTSKVFFYQGSEITFQNGANVIVDAIEKGCLFIHNLKKGGKI